MKTKMVLGVTGSIAAHKAADLASLLAKAKCDVRVVMTADAQHFITPLPFNPKAKMLIAPAMNGKMWLHAATQANVATLKKRGAEFIGPDEGMLSCGYEGIGRLWPVEKIAECALKLVR